MDVRINSLNLAKSLPEVRVLSLPFIPLLLKLNLYMSSISNSALQTPKIMITSSAIATATFRSILIEILMETIRSTIFIKMFQIHSNQVHRKKPNKNSIKKERKRRRNEQQQQLSHHHLDCTHLTSKSVN